jgi:hypothetical protein
VIAIVEARRARRQRIAEVDLGGDDGLGGHRGDCAGVMNGELPE